MLVAVKALFDRDAHEGLLIFDDRSGSQIDFDLRGSLEAMKDGWPKDIRAHLERLTPTCFDVAPPG